MISANTFSYQQFAEVAMWKLFKVQYVKKGGILLWIKLHKRKLIKDKLAWKFKTYKFAFLLSSQIHWERDFFNDLLILKLFCYLSNLNIQCYDSNMFHTKKLQDPSCNQNYNVKKLVMQQITKYGRNTIQMAYFPPSCYVYISMSYLRFKHFSRKCLCL